MIEVKNGDIVRVVLEGPVSCVRAGHFDVGESGVNVIRRDAEHVKSIEVIRRNFKVGDTVQYGDLLTLPVGAVIQSAMTRSYVLTVKSDGLAEATGFDGSERLAMLVDPYQILWLPDAES